MILIIDNYDSFIYNLYQYIGETEPDMVVYRNDKIDIEGIRTSNPDAIIISPGPGRPENAGICVEIIKQFYKTIPILGVCLGHQAIGYAFGAKIVNAAQIIHGKKWWIFHNSDNIFTGVSNPFEGGRYHSLIVDRRALPQILEVIAWTEKKEIMGVRVKNTKTYGLQFHPESILTDSGKQIINNFLAEVRND